MENITKILLDTNSINININKKYWWPSGILSPIYIDNWAIFNYPEKLKEMHHEMEALVLKKFPSVNKIIGVPSSGVCHAAILANSLNLPFSHCRKKYKDHGKKNLIEGIISKEDNVVLIQDLLLFGKTTEFIIKELNKKGVTVLGVICIFSYELEKTKKIFKNFHIPCVSMSKISEYIRITKEYKNSDKEALSVVSKFVKKINS